MRAPPNREYLRGEASPHKIRLLVLHIAMRVPIFSFICLNAAKLDLSKVVDKNTQRTNTVNCVN